jgi:hypothetical protein
VDRVVFRAQWAPACQRAGGEVGVKVVEEHP